jgi:hypothetical protein
VCPSSFIDHRRVRRIPHTLYRSKTLKHGHCWGRTSSIGADHGDDGIWIYGLAGSFVIINNVQIPSDHLICIARLTSSSTTSVAFWIAATLAAAYFIIVDAALRKPGPA